MLSTNAKTLCAALLKETHADGVRDMGSWDRTQAFLFRQFLAESAVLAFEANPIHCETMRANSSLAGPRTDVDPEVGT